MGGCVASIMSCNNSMSEKPHDLLLAARSIGQQSVEIGEARPGEGRIRRDPPCKDIDIFENSGNSYPSLLAWVKSSCEKYASRNAIAHRPWEKEETTTIIDDKGKEKPWVFVHLSATQYITYAGLWDLVGRIGTGLAKYKLTGQNCRIALYEDTRYEWIASLYAMWTQNAVAVTVYANLGEDALGYAVRESELTAVFLGGKSLKNISKLGAIPTLKYVITFEDAPAGTAIPPGVTVIKFSDLIKETASWSIIPNKTDIAIIMYTSGTTGDPKGVVMSHGNLLTCVECFSRRLVPALGPVPLQGETYVAYLPLAHILEMMAENVMYTRGSMVGYGNPRTLTDTAAKPHGDLKEFKPTVMAGVPRIYDTIKKAIEAKLPPVGSVKRLVFDRAFEDRRAALANGKDTPYWNDKAFGAAKSMLGGNVKMLISGGAPLNGATHEFLCVVFGCSVGQGYGLTETCLMGTLQRYWDIQKENVGGPVSGVEIKLKDVNEEWNSKSEPKRGEVWIRGPSVTQGYYKQPEKTAEVFGADGFFNTGDVGEWQRDGTLKIIGRVKALAKTAHGEYIAMEALESVYINNDLVLPNGICIVVDPQAPFIAAVALTDERKAMEFAAANGLSGTWPAILATDAFRQKALESFALTAKKANRKPFEAIKQLRFYSDEWTPENGIMTAASKLKRREVDKKYAADIKEMFSQAS